MVRHLWWAQLRSNEVLCDLPLGYVNSCARVSPTVALTLVRINLVRINSCARVSPRVARTLVRIKPAFTTRCTERFTRRSACQLVAHCVRLVASWTQSRADFPSPTGVFHGKNRRKSSAPSSKSRSGFAWKPVSRLLTCQRRTERSTQLRSYE